MFTIEIEYSECVKPCNRHKPDCFDNQYKTFADAVACVYEYFDYDFTNAQNNGTIDLMPCQKAEESCGFDAMVEAFDGCNRWLDFGDFSIRIKEACHFS